MNSIVIYFSAEGTTKRIAQAAGALLKTPVYEIKPVKPYTKGDLNWMNPLARCNREHLSKKEVPVEEGIAQFDAYDTVLLGFPIWYGAGSGMGKTKEKLMPLPDCHDHMI